MLTSVPASADDSPSPSDPADNKASSPTDSGSSPQAICAARKTQTIAANEEELAGYLLENPGFFQRHAETLADVRIRCPHSGRAISLQERQLEVLRQLNADTQKKLDTLMRAAKDNEGLVERLTQWTRQLLSVGSSGDMPASVAGGLEQIFGVPCVALRLWDVDISFRQTVDQHPANVSYFEEVDASTRRMTNDLHTPYCGLRGDIAQARWLEDGGVNIRSVALLSLRVADRSNAFGLIVLGSPDGDRFQNGMGTEFLERIAQTAGAALVRLTVSVKNAV